MLTSDFNYYLPPDRIAQRPAERGTSRLLVLDATRARRHRTVADLPEILQPGDLLVVNDTRVIPARLLGRTVAQTTGPAAAEGGAVELLLLERTADREWECLSRPGRRTRIGARLLFTSGLGAEILAKLADGKVQVRFSEPVEPHLETIGHVPLPPYIRRPDDLADRELYQTMFARHPGAVAAPTAGLHFTPALMTALAERGVEVARLTLHVGAGTFRPVTATETSGHQMESERYRIDEDTAAALGRARAEERRVVAVGTTVVRALEGAALAAGGTVPAGEGRTELFITPGFHFQVVDVLFTNFHLPCSTLLMLVCAFARRGRVLAAYEEAVQMGYHFYSYGDAMLAERRADGGPVRVSS
jgi:S-adenosylmethionine:tRNA ribosyltransferase-isomerase